MRRIAILFSLFIVAFTASVALACEEEPLPLRGMYLESDVVVVGRTGKAGKWVAMPREQGTQYTTFYRSFPIEVEKVIKGGADVKFTVSELGFYYAGNPDNSAPARSEMRPEDETGLSKNTGRQIFFLTKDENGHYVQLDGERSFAPQGKAQDVYISRLEQLAEMYKNGEPAKSRIVEWLVSLTEDPVTRMDGALELSNSFYDLKYKNDAAAENAGHLHSVKEAIAEVESHPQPYTEEELKAGQSEDDENGIYPVYGDAEFTRLLTAAQKERLVKAFMSVEFNYEPKNDGDDSYTGPLTQGDAHLAQTVVMMGDRRVTARVMSELPNMLRDDKYTTQTILDGMAWQIGDAKLKTLVQKFFGVAYGRENENVEPKSSAYDLEEGLSETEKEAQLANLPAKTYGRRSSELLNQIYASMNQLTAKK